MDETARKRVLRMIPYTLFVVGVRNDKEIGAFTGSWLTQLSFHPPMVGIGVKKAHRSHDILFESGAFTLNFLDRSQKSVAQHFFSAPRHEGDRLKAYPYREGIQGCPLFDFALGHLQCRVRNAVEVGDHTLFVGEIVDASLLREADILELKETGWKYGG
jgi:flavin reductase (DIM6/NTAB) family NADH-FMN oxidoreductase RutF